MIETEKNWASKPSFLDRLRFFRDTGVWPGGCSKDSLRMFMEGNIEAEIADGKLGCARRKRARASEIGLEIKVSVPVDSQSITD